MERVVDGVAYVSQYRADDSCKGCAAEHFKEDRISCFDLPMCKNMIFIRKLDAVSTSEPPRLMDIGPMVQSDPAPPVDLNKEFYKLNAARRTLESIGYTYHGGVHWAPPGWPAPALCRSTDPSTSQKAAQSMARKAGKIAELILVELGSGMPVWSNIKPKLTGKELAARTGVPLNSITPRFAQLSRKGLIHAHSGKGRETVWALGNGVAA